MHDRELTSVTAQAKHSIIAIPPTRKALRADARKRVRGHKLRSELLLEPSSLLPVYRDPAVGQESGTHASAPTSCCASILRPTSRSFSKQGIRDLGRLVPVSTEQLQYASSIPQPERSLHLFEPHEHPRTLPIVPASGPRQREIAAEAPATERPGQRRLMTSAVGLKVSLTLDRRLVEGSRPRHLDPARCHDRTR